MELERHDNILLVAHQATLRCIFAYFLDVGHDELPYIKVPLHTLIELIPNAHGCEKHYYRGNEEWDRIMDLLADIWSLNT